MFLLIFWIFVFLVICCGCCALNIWLRQICCFRFFVVVIVFVVVIWPSHIISCDKPYSWFLHWAEIQEISGFVVALSKLLVQLKCCVVLCSLKNDVTLFHSLSLLFVYVTLLWCSHFGRISLKRILLELTFSTSVFPVCRKLVQISQLLTIVRGKHSQRRVGWRQVSRLHSRVLIKSRGDFFSGSDKLCNLILRKLIQLFVNCGF